MSGYEDQPRCEGFEPELAELALGILSGRRRSDVLSHVASCPRCTAELERLSIVADKLLHLAPEIEPPLGFELRLAERLQERATISRPRRFRRVALVSAAAAAVVMLGFGLGALVIPRGQDNPGQLATVGLRAAHLTSHGKVVGEVMISAGRPAWMFMTLDRSPWAGEVTCEVTLAGGKVETVGVFRLSGDYGAWGTSLTSPASEVRSARLVAPDGSILASAQVSA